MNLLETILCNNLRSFNEQQVLLDKKGLESLENLEGNFCKWNLLYLEIAVNKSFPAGNYMFKVNNRNTRTRCEICSKLTIKIPERRQWRRSGIFIVNFEHISHLVLVFLLLTLSKKISNLKISRCSIFMRRCSWNYYSDKGVLKSR